MQSPGRARLCNRVAIATIEGSMPALLRLWPVSPLPKSALDAWMGTNTADVFAAITAAAPGLVQCLYSVWTAFAQSISLQRFLAAVALYTFGKWPKRLRKMTKSSRSMQSGPLNFCESRFASSGWEQSRLLARGCIAQALCPAPHQIV